MWLLVGLGNPGPQYAGNRHNIGFMVMDAAQRRLGFGPWRREAKFFGHVAEHRELAGARSCALKPDTFMNDSGRAVAALARLHKVPPERVVVFHDELDLAPGKVRVKLGGGAAGHNGLRSIDHLFGNGTLRVRLGIGHPGHKQLVHGYVLRDFHPDDRGWVERLVEAAATELPVLLTDGPEAYMTRLALVAPPPRPPAKETSSADEG